MELGAPSQTRGWPGRAAGRAARTPASRRFSRTSAGALPSKDDRAGVAAGD